MKRHKVPIAVKRREDLINLWLHSTELFGGDDHLVFKNVALMTDHQVKKTLDVMKGINNER